MQRHWFIIVAAAGLWAGGLAAQEPPAAPRAPRAPRARAFSFSFSDNRGRLGVIVRTDASAESDKIGAKIEGVTPGSPADKGGLKVGDIITKFAGTSLGGIKGDDEDESGPGHKLVALARKLEPGDTVRIEYRRGADAKQATLVAEDLDGTMRMDMPGPMVAMPHMPGMDLAWSFGEPWGDLEMVSLNPVLGDYFGSKDCILVVKAPADSTLPLKGGDVILSIGGRKPTSQSHAMRILRSYEPGESVSIDILRKQKRMSLTWKVPEAREHRMRHELERVRREQERHEREEQSGLRRQLRRVTRLQRV